MDVKNLLEQTIDLKASDLHIVAGVPPMVRLDGDLKSIVDNAILTPDIINEGLKQILTKEQLERFIVNKEIDFSLAFSEKARFRVNAYTQKGSMAASFRRIPLEIPEIDALGLPKIARSFTNLKQGLVLVTGPTGHGKSTTLAAIINEINKNRACHIVTIEDPIEFIFKPIKSIISQREMKSDTHSWQVALRSVLREDPDVVLVGEMRDYETISAAMTIAETGHLVFGTLHTNSASQTVDRIVDVFPENQQNQIRMQLSSILEAVFSQRLIKASAGGRLVAHEVMLGTTAIKTAIREGKSHQIDSIIQTSLEAGMSTLEHSLASLVKTNKITIETAQEWTVRPDELNRLIKGSL
ncbi:MAG: type IV pilus twitching motility protein PilT [Candidatus Woesebacteria bacterium]|nr:type IV pilus twitching motility protein PilT [Candidatus Woesebacteria bacterium]